MRFEKTQKLRNRFNRLSGGSGSSASISNLPRLREAMVPEPRGKSGGSPRRAIADLKPMIQEHQSQPRSSYSYVNGERRGRSGCGSVESRDGGIIAFCAPPPTQRPISRGSSQSGINYPPLEFTTKNSALQCNSEFISSLLRTSAVDFESQAAERKGGPAQESQGRREAVDAFGLWNKLGCKGCLVEIRDQRYVKKA